FFIERAQQLAVLGQSVIGSIAAIATGNLGNAVNAVEQAMVRTLPVVLGFLARLIGLGDIAAPVRRVIDAVRVPVAGALDRVADGLAVMGRRVADVLRGSHREEPVAVTRPESRPMQAPSAPTIEHPFDVEGGFAHTLSAAASGEVHVASRPQPLTTFLA